MLFELSVTMGSIDSSNYQQKILSLTTFLLGDKYLIPIKSVPVLVYFHFYESVFTDLWVTIKKDNFWVSLCYLGPSIYYLFVVVP